MYAIVQTGGKQYQVAPGDMLDVEKIDAAVGETVELSQVLLIRDGENLLVGKPTVENASIKAKVLTHDRRKKVIVFKLKRRKGYRRKQGHRQDFTRIRIEQILADGIASEPNVSNIAASEPTVAEPTVTEQSSMESETEK